MKKTTAQLGGSAIELPAGAPMIRITAGVGSAGQKTWNIRRPVTLIGACRPAHIVLRNEEVSKCHCVIINTGTDVLLKDLHTTHGTSCNQQHIDLIALKDGDVISIGGLKIQVAIRMPEDKSDDSGCGLAYVEPTQFPKPVLLHLEHTDQQWRVEEGVTLIGRHKDAGIRVDHPDVSSRHAILFRFADAQAIVDIGSGSGIAVNGQRCPMAGLKDGDRIAVGPCTLLLGSHEAASLASSSMPSSSPSQPTETATGTGDGQADGSAMPEGQGMDWASRGEASPRRSTSPFTAISDSLRAGGIDDESAQALSKIETDLGTLQQNMSGSWDRLNSWESKLRKDATHLDRKQLNLSAREAELDAHDAALRGQLHDLTRYHEQISAREKELAVQLAKIQNEKDSVAKAQSDLTEREVGIVRKADELTSREHVLAQRWARVQSAACPHCGKAMRSKPPGAPKP